MKNKKRLWMIGIFVACAILLGVAMGLSFLPSGVISPKSVVNGAPPIKTMAVAKALPALNEPISIENTPTAYSVEEVEYLVQRQCVQMTAKQSQQPLSQQDIASKIEDALNVCQPFQYADVLNVTRLERGCLVAHCVVASADETVEILIRCRDTSTVEWFKQRFDTLSAPDYEPLVLRGAVCCHAVLPFLQAPPAGVETYAFYRKAKLRNTVATSPRFIGISSKSAIENSLGLGYYGLDGSGEIVAVIDSGISSGDYTTSFHVDLKEGLYGMATEPSSSNASPKDYSGHGTHVCGSIISRGSTSNTLLTQSGAQGARLFAQSIGTSTADINPMSDYGQHFERSALVGANIISNSWGAAFWYWSDGGYDDSTKSIDAFVWNNPEALVLFACGNDGWDSNGDGIPDEKTMLSVEPYAKNALIVGAQESYRENSLYVYGSKFSSNAQIAQDYLARPYDGKTDGMAVFSSRGPLTDGRISPMLVAPGTVISSTSSSGTKAYADSSGTSMATPQVAASAAVFRQYLKEYHKIERPTAAVMRAGLILCADSLYPGQYGSSPPEVPKDSPNNAEGWGALRLGKHLAGIAVDGTKDTPQTLGFKDRISLIDTNESYTFSFTTTKQGEVRVVLSWIDFYDVYTTLSFTSTIQPLYNDYDLEVVGPDETVYTLDDHLNPIERIIIEDAPVGEYTVRIRCSRMVETGTGNIAAVAWSAPTGETAKTFHVPETPNTTYSLTVKLPEDVIAYTDYPIWPSPGTHTFGANETFSPIAGPKLAYVGSSGTHEVKHLAGWILFDAEGTPLQQHFPEHKVVVSSSHAELQGVTQVLKKPIQLSSDNCTLQWYTTFPGYGIRLK